MLPSNIKKVYKKNTGERICQGDVLRDILFSSTYENIDVPVLIKYAVVMSQDCDLKHDYKNRKEPEAKNNDKFLPTVLICPAYVSEQFFKGEHINDWKMTCFSNEKEQKKIKDNNVFNRYHFLAEETKLSIPNLVIDFKHFYTIPKEIIGSQYEGSYLATVNELFRERLSQRFSNHLSRFGLPELSGITNSES
jgi:hypothetical protein